MGKRLHMQNSPLNIRQALRNDVPLILALIKELAVYERLAHKVTATVETLEQSLFGKHHAEAVLAEVNGKVVGFAIYFFNFSSFEGKAGLYLEDLFVRPEARTKGVGLAIFKHLAQLAVKNDCARFEWSVLDWNEPAIGFYKKLGAFPMSDWTVYRMERDVFARL